MVVNPCHSHLAVVRLHGAPSVAGRWLLTEVLKYLEIIGPTDALPEITCTPMGKPYFKQSIYPGFNISHSKTHVAVYLAGVHEVGCDLEQIYSRPGWQRLAAEYFSPAENEQLIQLSATAAMRLFWQYWTAREACLKQQGKSIWDMTQLALDTSHLKQIKVLNSPLHLQHLTFQQQQLCLCHTQAFERIKACRVFGQGVLISYEHATGVNNK